MPIPGKTLPPASRIEDLISSIYEIYRRAIDGTVVPLFVDNSNQRVIVGATVSAGSGAPFQVQSGDIEVTTSAKGVILKDDGGSGKTCRITATYNASVDGWTLNLTGITVFLLSLLFPHRSIAGNNKLISEGVPSTLSSILITTTTPRVYFSTGSYGGSVSNVSIYTSSNVVISNDKTDKIVLYSSGGINLGGVPLPSVSNMAILNGTQTFTGANTLGGGIKISSGATVGDTISGHFSKTASLDFAATSGQTCDDITISIPGAADGDDVSIGVPNALASTDSFSQFSGFISAAGVVSVRRCCISAAACSNPSGATVRVSVWKH